MMWLSGLDDAPSVNRSTKPSNYSESRRFNGLASDLLSPGAVLSFTVSAVPGLWFATMPVWHLR